MNNTTIILDIETIPASDPDIRDYIAKTVKHPGTIKLPASIEKWNENERPAAIDDAVSKTGLDGAFGQVCCIGYDLLNDGNPNAIYGLDESQLLCDFNEALDSIPHNLWSAIVIVGHNVSAFDLRFLFQRYIVNGIKPHPIINVAASAKTWDNQVYDTMTKFAGYGNRISLDKLCMALGVPTPKGDMDGSMVGQYVADGRIDEVADYCKKDVAATRAVYRRMTFSTPIDQPETTEMQPEENTPESAPALEPLAQAATETVAFTPPTQADFDDGVVESAAQEQYD